MVEARLANGDLFKNIIGAIKELITEANFDCSSHGIKVQCMDSSHVSLVSLVLLPSAFEVFRVENNISLGITIASLAKVLKISKNHSLTLRSKDDSLSLLFEDAKQTTLSHYCLKLMNVDTEYLDIPPTDYDGTIRLPVSEFSRVCRETSNLGDTVKITINKEGVQFHVMGEIGSGTIFIKTTPEDADEKTEVTVTAKKEVVLSFSLKYLSLFSKGENLSSHVILQMSPDVPMVVSYPFEGDCGYLRFYLAPKIADENEFKSGD